MKVSCYSLRVLAMAIAIGQLTVGPAIAGPILEFSSATTGPAITGASAGWSFTTNQAVSVVALDAFDPTGDGNVRLYNASGIVLASATVTNADPIEGSPIPFYSHAITPVMLAANTTYYIAQDLGPTTLFSDQATGLTTGPAITYGGGVVNAGLGLNPIADANGGSLDPAYFGPNFDIAPAVVPEPSSLVLAGIASLAGLGIPARRLWARKLARG